MSIDFRCPECQKMLRVPAESAGVKAKCPECGSVVDIPRAESAGDDEQEGLAGLPPNQDSNPFGEGDQPFQPAAKSAGGDSGNPYQSPISSGYESVGAQPLLSGAIVATPVEAGQVIRYAWEVWKSNLGILFGITAVVVGMNMGLSMVQNIAQAIAAQQGQQEIGILIAVVVGFSSNFLQLFLGIGNYQIVLKLLRGQPAQFGELFGGGPLFLRVLGASILAGIAMVVGMLACIIPGLILVVLFWPFYFLLIDQKATAIDSFGMAYSIGKENVGTTLLLWLTSMGMVLVGLLAFCVGVLFAAPLVGTMWGAAYLMMSGQLALKPSE